MIYVKIELKEHIEYFFCIIKEELSI